MTIQYQSSGWSEECIRSYPEVLETISEVGGLIEIAILGVALLYTWYNEYLKNSFLKQQVVNENQVVAFYNQLPLVKQDNETPGKQSKPSLTENIPKKKSVEKMPAKIVSVNKIGQPKSFQTIDSGLAKPKIKFKSDAISNDTSKKQQQEITPLVFSASSVTSHPHQKQHLRKLGTAIINEHSEFTKLIDHLSTCQILSEALLTDEQKQLLPILKIEMQKKKAQDKSLSKVANSRITSTESSPPLDLMASLKALFMDPTASVEREKRPTDSPVTASINRYFKSHLNHLLLTIEEIGFQE